MSKLAEQLAQKVDPERLQKHILAMVKIPSPPCEEREVSEYYADLLREIGMEVEMDPTYPTSPNVIGRYKGGADGPTLQFDGHTDTIAAPGPEVRCEGDWIYGRGTVDMKTGLVMMAEAMRIIIESGIKLKGNLLLTAHGRHESGTNETLEALLKKGIYGEAVINTEGLNDELPIVGIGLAIWEMTFSREGESIHENSIEPGTPHPLYAGMKAMALLKLRSEELAKVDLPMLGPESIFVGKFQCGDYFNRLPVKCVISGSRRFGPEGTLEKMKAEIDAIAQQVAKDFGLQAEVTVSGLDSFKLSEEEKIVKVIRKAHQQARGRDMKLRGWRSVGNVSNFMKNAKIPGVYCGVSLATAHADNERVSLQQAVEITQVYIHAIIEYLGVAE
ncbi:MAG: M20/M25/M40 family metallo-hydrolase [Planctomycetes bacterium]|nr:M20/M25/M40 family metallo-hydrolase [Planctomycetota bacterium]